MVTPLLKIDNFKVIPEATNCFAIRTNTSLEKQENASSSDSQNNVQKPTDEFIVPSSLISKEEVQLSDGYDSD